MGSLTGNPIVVGVENDAETDAFARIFGVTPVTTLAALRSKLAFEKSNAQHNPITIRRADFEAMAPEMKAEILVARDKGSFSVILIEGGAPGEINGEAAVVKTIAAITEDALAAFLEMYSLRTNGFIDAKQVAQMEAMKFIVDMFETAQSVAVAA